MSFGWNILAEGPGWRVSDIVCTAGPGDRPFEERHESVCIAAVTAGSFQYRASHGAAVLTPGSLLLGNHGACFECGHDHATGDRCIAFNFSPEYQEAIVAALPGARRTDFTVPRLPPLGSLPRILAAAEAARDDGDGGALEELALELAGTVATLLADAGRAEPSPNARDARRITEALRRIEAEAPEKLLLDDLARGAAMSRYHFLRTFRRVVGMTPHQYVLHTRLHRAAVHLRRTDAPVLTIALEAGFEDLSTFNRRFRRGMGKSPSAYRAGRAI
jgi:AraC family transcriptional regulator